VTTETGPSGGKYSNDTRSSYHSGRYDYRDVVGSDYQIPSDYGDSYFGTDQVPYRGDCDYEIDKTRVEGRNEYFDGENQVVLFLF